MIYRTYRNNKRRVTITPTVPGLLFLAVLVQSTPLASQTSNDLFIADSTSQPALEKAGDLFFLASLRTSDTSIGITVLDPQLSSLAGPTRLSAAQFPSNPAVRFNGSSALVVWWSQFMAPINYYGVFGRILSSQGDPLGSEIRIDQRDYNNPRRAHATVAVLDDTLFVVAWGGNGPPQGDTFRPYVRLLNKISGAIGDNVPVALDDEVSAGIPFVKICVEHSLKQILAIWRRTTSGGEVRIRGRILDGTLWPSSPTFQIVEDSAYDALWDLGASWINPDTFIVAWSELRDDEWRINGRFFNRLGVPVSSTLRINDPAVAVTSSAFVSTALEESGQFVVLWDGESAGRGRIYGQAFHADGSKHGASFKVSSEPLAGHHYYSSSVLSDGILTTIWMTYIPGYPAPQLWGNQLILDDVTSVPGLPESPNPLATSALLTAFPNPFNGSTHISFKLPFDGLVSLRVYDSMGREVASLLHSCAQRGNTSVAFHAPTLASGLYFCQLNWHGGNEIVKLLILR